MFSQPNPAELIAALRHFLEHSAIPNLSGHAAFHGRVAANVAAILERELADGPAAVMAETLRLRTLLSVEGELNALRIELIRRIDAGEIDETSPLLLQHLMATAADRVAIEQPGYASLALARRCIADAPP